jgi:hypothetical protein
MNIAKVSLELLYHFNCCVCSSWWSVGDFNWPTDPQAYVFCPHCGTVQLLPEVSPSPTPTINLPPSPYEGEGRGEVQEMHP